MFSNSIYKWLNSCLDYGISEREFWESTIAELGRMIESKKRIEKRQAQEKASYDYILADLVGKSIARLYSSSNNMPDIAQAYPTIFDTQEIQEKRQEKQAELSALRFKLFADSFNQRYKEVKENE